MPMMMFIDSPRGQKPTLNRLLPEIENVFLCRLGTKLETGEHFNWWLVTTWNTTIRQQLLTFTTQSEMMVSEFGQVEL